MRPSSHNRVSSIDSRKKVRFDNTEDQQFQSIKNKVTSSAIKSSGLPLPKTKPVLPKKKDEKVKVNVNKHMLDTNPVNIKPMAKI